jgi:UDP-2,3-diacylglucosamine hydrolase
MRVIFLSDAHLRRDSMDNYRYLIRFLDERKTEVLHARYGEGVAPAAGGETLTAQPIDALYLMGDVFDFWFAKGDHYYPGFDRFINLLKDLRALGVQIHLFEGNHDFFLREYFSKRLGIMVYEDDAAINLDGWRFYVAHGDLVDQTNHKYLFLRKVLRSRFIRLLHGVLPSRLVWWIALKCSDTSKTLWAKTGKQLSEKMCCFAQGMGNRGFDGVILGHSHQPLLWEFKIEERKKVLVTLGDWLTYRSYLDYHDGGFDLKYYENMIPDNRAESCILGSR